LIENGYRQLGQVAYNPITNPIPFVNQNPYIQKGELDVASHARRGNLNRSMVSPGVVRLE